MSRRGFTLLELVVAIAVTGVVAVLAYATLQAGLDASERVDRARLGVSTEAVARSLIVDALRHLPEGGGAAMNERLFVVEDRIDPSGLAADRMTFVSHGVGRAPGASAGWLVTLGPSEGGVRLRAEPVEAADGAPVELELGGARGVDVWVLARTADVEWLGAWDALGRVPAAVRVELLDAGGRPLGPPIVAEAGLEAVP